MLEVTTIMNKSQQFSVEASSVPDHIRLYRDKTNQNVHGIFIAPILHDRVNIVIQSVATEHGFAIHCISDTNFLGILVEKSRDEILSYLLTK